jgi:hypothetical protein
VVITVIWTDTVTCGKLEKPFLLRATVAQGTIVEVRMPGEILQPTPK